GLLRLLGASLGLAFFTGCSFLFRTSLGIRSGTSRSFLLRSRFLLRSLLGLLSLSLRRRLAVAAGCIAAVFRSCALLLCRLFLLVLLVRLGRRYWSRGEHQEAGKQNRS